MILIIHHISEEPNKTSDKQTTASELSSETSSLIYRKLPVISHSSSFADIIEDQNSSQSFEPSSVIQPSHTYNLRSRPLASSQSQRTRSTSSSLSALVRQHAQSRSTTDTETRSSLQSPLSIIPTSGFETSHTVHSYPRSIQIIGDIETPSLLSNPNTADLPYHTLDETFKTSNS